MNVTPSQLERIIASAITAALAGQPKAAAPRKAPVKARKAPVRSAKPTVSAKAARNAATGTTRSERRAAHAEWLSAIACDCKPFRDIRTVARWDADGFEVIAKSTPVQVAKTGAELFCRHQVAELPAA